ncbi:hypothetical protein ACOMHN_056500 [Nucella lapillus]
MRMSQRVLSVCLLALAGFGSVYLMLYNAHIHVFFKSHPQQETSRDGHHEDLLLHEVVRGRPERGDEAQHSGVGLVEGAERQGPEGASGGQKGIGSPGSRKGTISLEGGLENEKKEDGRTKGASEDHKKNADKNKGEFQDQKIDADKNKGEFRDQKIDTDKNKGEFQDQKIDADKNKGEFQDQKIDADKNKGEFQDQKIDADKNKGEFRDQIIDTIKNKGEFRDQKREADKTKGLSEDQKTEVVRTKGVFQDQKKEGGGHEGELEVGKNSTNGVAQDGGKDSGKTRRVHPPQTQTSDHWPVFSKDYYPGRIPPSPFHPNFTIRWDFNTSAFLQRPDVKGQPPKLMTWMVKTRYMLPLPEPVRLRVCPEMPCRMTTNQEYGKESAALLWAGQIMREPRPPVRSHPDQVFVFHNHEPQTPEWIYSPSFRKPAWRSAFNWTMHYRVDSDIIDLYGKLVKREKPLTAKNYTDIVARKTKMAAWLVSNCRTHGKREKYIALLQKHMQVDKYGGCSDMKCPRNVDDSCFKMIVAKYKFFLAFENAFCKDYISEKFFRYFGADTIVVARGSNQYADFAPPGTFVNTADFNSTQELAKYLLYLDSHPEEYIKILKAKDQYQPLYEDWPIRTEKGQVRYMHYHYESVSYCEMCRRLWDLDKYRKTIPSIVEWFDKENCYTHNDLV